MTIEELARQVKACRDLQREYFRTRHGNVLNECRDAERRLDAVVKDVLDPPQPGLFDDGPKEEA